MADEKGMGEKILDQIKEWRDSQPNFSGQVAAMWREGLKDLQNAILPAFPESQRGVEEPGTPLSPTSQQVTQDMGNFKGYQEMLESYSPPQTPSIRKESELER
jgi:hypothetical protein